MGDGMIGVMPVNSKMVASFDELACVGIEVAMFENDMGNFAVLVKRDQKVKGLLCINRHQADDLYETCCKKVCERFICN